MTRSIKLNQLDVLLADLSYPCTVETAASKLDDVVLAYADGTEPLTAVLGRVSDDRFESVDDARSSILNAVPVEGVGEPGQSEGEG